MGSRSSASEARRPQEPSVGRRYRPDLAVAARALRLVLDYRRKKGAAAESHPESDAMKVKGLKHDRAPLDSTAERPF